MKKKIIAFLLMIGLIVTGCSNNNTKDISPSGNETSQSENKDTIYASFYPIYNLTKQIAGDKFIVKSFTNLKTEVHDFEPSAKEMSELSKAKVLFLNGADLESWKDSIDSSIGIDIVDTSVGIDLIKKDKNNNEEKNVESNDEDNYGKSDPHIWLSAKNLIVQAKNISKKLEEIDPDNKDYYDNNFKKIKGQFEEIDNKYTKLLKNKKNRKFLVDHEAFSYLARDYNLEQIALSSITSTSETDANTMKKAIDFVKDNNIKAIFYEKGGSDKNVKILADELSLDVKPINTIEYASDEDLKEEKSLQELIKENLEILESTLE